ncbi:Saccharopine dehydrogenase-domain-containing protein [Dunaliella salina]|uniref:Saccharopine dehydrogenase-domain-containing protein n=1 Tax=Dunaliella salina TaxID=3046 RepID=A0ABQ7GFP3_DUNSA|nr:Saccharopine dehydrogenase-domain-containing protein [Dunaliella salina]|eukprot:KAF5833430.1 Saccharopine dehydrogenase-domain-containing protein [Dunaliella salina]
MLHALGASSQRVLLPRNGVARTPASLRSRNIPSRSVIVRVQEAEAPSTESAAPASTPTRPYEVVVWGATGFTGKLVCEHLARDYGGKVKWAMAGRDNQKLEKVREELAQINPDVKDIPLLVADANNASEVGDVLKQSKVVVSLAGPFANVGNEVVAQAVEQGTHYCDITGELTWVRRNMEKYHATAEAKGTKIVHCCGYDSAPSDIGALMMAEYAERELGKKCAKVYTLAGLGLGGASGGTLATGMNMMEKEPLEMSKVARDQYYLASYHKKTLGYDTPAPFWPTGIPETGEWGGPWVMEPCNARVVQLSNALLSPQGPYGRDFRYKEVLAGGGGLPGFLVSSLVTAIMGIGGFALSTPQGMALFKRLAPAQGEGPPKEIQRNGYWSHKLVGVTEEPEGQEPTVFTGECSDSRDPGYWSTSRMVLEAALCMALDEGAIKKSGKCRDGGVLTPASAMGLALMERFKGAGLKFEVHGPVK